MFKHKQKNIIWYLHAKALMYIVMVFVCGILYIPKTYGFRCNDGCSDHARVSLRIANSFSGITTLPSSPWSTWWVLYTSSRDVEIELSASTGSEYIAFWSDIAIPITGLELSSYSIPRYVTLSGADGLKIISSEYNKWLEILHVPDLQIFLDTTPPSQANPVGPFLGSTQTDPLINFSRTPSTDTNVWFASYTLVISTSPSFSSPITFDIIQTNLEVPQNIIPTGVLYRYVQAHDHLGNTSNGLPAFFTNVHPRSNKTQWLISSIDLWEEENQEEFFETQGDKQDQEHYSAVFPQVKRPSLREQIRLHNILNYIRNRNNNIHQTVINDWEQYNNLYENITLPGYLARTWADPSTIQRYLLLLQEWCIDSTVKEQLQTIIHFIQPGRSAGIIILMSILCYDIEIYRKRQKINHSNRKK